MFVGKECLEDGVGVLVLGWPSGYIVVLGGCCHDVFCVCLLRYVEKFAIQTFGCVCFWYSLGDNRYVQCEGGVGSIV